jgi:hypothetical protein
MVINKLVNKISNKLNKSHSFSTPSPEREREREQKRSLAKQRQSFVGDQRTTNRKFLPEGTESKINISHQQPTEISQLVSFANLPRDISIIELVPKFKLDLQFFSGDNPPKNGESSEPKKEKTPYEILGLSENATEAEIKEA